MDISYHYFAVKTLALKAGFIEEEAQTIATFSQYIDDYNLYAFRRYSNIPDYIKKDPYDLYIGNILNPANFNPATTGFWDIIDFAVLVTKRSQRFTVSPFHFIPQNKERKIAEDCRTTPASLNDGSYISDMLKKAQENFRKSSTKTSRRQALMQIGMLLHTFADTYAHQLFSGYHENCNLVKLIKVINNITNEDETQKYHDSIIKWLERLQQIAPGLTPAIGHMMLNHIPDLTHLSFTMEYSLPDTSGLGTHSRSNTSEFVRASKEVINFLRVCLQKEEVAPNQWNDLSKKMAQGFLIDISTLDEKTTFPALRHHWSEIFKDEGYIYEYDRNTALNVVLGEDIQENQELTDDSLEKDMSDDFFRYNAFADELLIELYGSKPRKDWFNELCELEN